MKKLMNNLTKIFTFSIIFLIFTSCNIFKKISTKNDNENVTLTKQDLIDSININSLEFNTLLIKYSAKYITKEQNITFSGDIRIIKDSAILITIAPIMGIELARALILKDTIKFYNTLQNAFFIENNDFFQKKYGIAANYTTIQAILCNQLFTYPYFYDINKYKHSLDTNFFYLQNTIYHPRNNKIIDVNHTFFINKKYKIDSVNIVDDITLKTLNIKYGKFEQLNNQNFPTNIFLSIISNQNINLEFTFKKILLNKALNIKFKIPKNAKNLKI